MNERWQQLEAMLQTLWKDTLSFPWKNTAATLRERFGEDQLGVTASSLTFTTTISLVPLFTVALAIFSAFPVFGRLQDTLQSWLLKSLVPEHIAKQVLSYLTQFASKAGEMGWAGALVLLVTALALILTIDRKLNDIWRVRESRPFTQRVLVYWAALTLGPLLLAGSLSLTSYALSASKGLVTSLPDVVNVLFSTLQFVLMGMGMAALYRFVPNTRVRWSHAMVGGFFVAVGLELAKKLLGWYLSTVPTYSVVYGTFASVPILLVWIYLAWVIVLLGAVVTAYLPSLLAGIARRADTPGWDFILALEILQKLREARASDARGMGLESLAQVLKVDPLSLEVPAGHMLSLDWLARLNEEDERYVLLVDLDQMPLADLAGRLLLGREDSTHAFWAASGWNQMTVEEALGPLGKTLPTALAVAGA